MKQIRDQAKQKSVRKPNSFVSVNSTWCTAEYVKITLPDEVEAGLREVRELLDTSTNDAGTHQP